MRFLGKSEKRGREGRRVGLLTGEECLWRKVVVEKYGPLELEGSISVSEGRG